MNKSKLKALDLSATELLTREQMKYVFGGTGSGGSGGVVNCDICQIKGYEYHDGYTGESYWVTNSSTFCPTNWPNSWDSFHNACGDSGTYQWCS